MRKFASTVLVFGASALLAGMLDHAPRPVIGEAVSTRVASAIRGRCDWHGAVYSDDSSYCRAPDRTNGPGRNCPGSDKTDPTGAPIWCSGSDTKGDPHEENVIYCAAGALNCSTWYSGGLTPCSGS